MEDQIELLLNWYKKNKYEFVSSAYLDKSTFLKRIIIPYSDWDKAEVLKKEVAFNIKALAKLKEQFEKSGIKSPKEALSIMLLCLKNRAEYASNQSDFFPVYATLIIFSFTVMTISTSLLFKVLLGAGVLGVVAICIAARIKTRLVVAHTKELINILELYKSELLARHTESHSNSALTEVE